MPFKPGNKAAAGRNKGMGRRLLTKSIKEALEGRGKYSFDDIAERLVTIAMEEKDTSIALKAIKEITDRIEGKAPVQKEEAGDDLFNQQLMSFFRGQLLSPHIVAVGGAAQANGTNGHAQLEHQPNDGDESLQ